MGNGDRPDPGGIHTREDLAHALSVLRSLAGLTVRDLAHALDAPAATLGDYFAGRHLPGPRQLALYRSVLDACGLIGAEEQEPWMAALTRARLTSDGRSPKGLAPYRGLEPFRQSDAELFFGRRAVTEELLERLRRLRDDPSSPCRAVVLVGPSGSGKSSLLMAGLATAVVGGALDTAEGGWEPVAVTSEQLSSAAPGWETAASEGKRPLVIVDQFEEAFALSAAERAELFGRLEDLYRHHALVVLGLRADFYQAASEEPALLEALRHSQLLLGPLTEEELREALQGPAQVTGTAVEEGLVDLVLADLAPGSPHGFAHAQGVLPLLSYALLATWQRAGRNYLTIADYRAAGGLRGAVRQAAEELYAGLSPDERESARRLFARLVHLDAEGPPTRRKASRLELSELEEPRDGAGPLATVLERFVASRLVTVDAGTVSMSHDALLGAWPRLSEWVETDREWLRLHHQLADAARAWVEAGRDESMLLRGARLETALEGASEAHHDLELSRSEAELFAASLSYRDQQQRAARRRTRRTQQLLGALTVLAVAAIVFAAIAVDARDAATRAKDQALSRQVAIEARQLAPTDPSLAAQLALAAYRISATTQARSALVDATAGEIPTRLLGPVGPEFVSLSGNGRLLAVAQSANDTVALYGLSGSHPTRLAELRAGPGSGHDFAVALSPDGRLLAAGGTDHTVTLWNVTSPTRARELAVLRGFTSTVYSVCFSPRSRRLAAGGADGTVRQWDLAGSGPPKPQPVLHAPAGASVKTVSYSPDGRLLAAAGAGGTVALWKPGATQPAVASGSGTAGIETVAFSPNGSQLVTGGDDLQLRIWNLGPHGHLHLARPPLTAATSQLFSTAFSPAGHTLAVASADGSIHLYDTATWSVVSSFQAPDPVTSVEFAPDGHTLVTGDSGGVTRIWALPLPSTYTEPGRVYYLGYTGKGRRLVAGSSGPHGDATIWNVENSARLVKASEVIPSPGFGPVAGAVAASPNGRLVAVANSKAQIQIFDITGRSSRPEPLGPPLEGNKPYIEQLGFSPDGKLLAAGDDSGQVRLWNVSDPSRPRPLPTLTGTTGLVLGFAFSGDSRLLATASTDDKVRLYDIADLHHPILTATLGGFSDYAYDTAFTPNGRTLIAGSADGTIEMWDISNLRRPRLLGRPLSGPTGYVYAIAVSPDGRTLAAATTNHAVWVWDISDPAHPRLEETLSAGTKEAFAVDFSPGGHSLAASGSDDTIHLWRYRPADAARRVCSSVGDPITRAEWARYIQAPYRPPCG